MVGRIGPNSPYSFDSTTMKGPDEVRAKYRVMQVLGERGLVTAGKDISNPGVIGTLGMLVETSKVGACVDITKIPAPPEVDFTQWLKVHPATGFIVTCLPENEGEVVRLFEDAGYAAARIGVIEDSHKLDICENDECVTVFDFMTDVVTGITH